MSFPRYPEYKDSGVEWLGQVPAHWETMRLGDVCAKIGSGKTPLGGAETYVDDGVKFIRSQNVYDNGLRLDDVVFIDYETHRSLAGSSVVAADVLLNITGASIGRTCIVPDGLGEANVNQHVCVLRFRDSKSAPFLSLALKADVVKQLIAVEQYGAAREALTFRQISRFAVALPPEHERDAIVAFLDRETAKIDSLVAEQERLIALLKEKRQAVISHAVTKGINPDAPMKDSGVEWLGEVPSHWTVERLAHLFKDTNEQGSDQLPILSVSIHTGVSDTELDDAELDRKVNRSDDRSKYKRVLPDDLVYNMMRAWQGAFGTVREPGMVSPAYIVARPYHRVETAYIEYQLRTPNAIEQMRRFSRGVTDFRLRLYWEEFKNIRVALPPPPEQRDIIQAVQEIDSKFDGLSAACSEAIEQLNLRRSALITAAVTGQIDVRGLAQAEAA